MSLRICACVEIVFVCECVSVCIDVCACALIPAATREGEAPPVRMYACMYVRVRMYVCTHTCRLCGVVFFSSVSRTVYIRRCVCMCVCEYVLACMRNTVLSLSPSFSLYPPSLYCSLSSSLSLYTFSVVVAVVVAGERIVLLSMVCVCVCMYVCMYVYVCMYREEIRHSL